MSRVLILIVAFFLIGALFIIGNNNLELYKKENLNKFGSLYTIWLKQIFSNFNQITGEATKLNWFSNISEKG